MWLHASAVLLLISLSTAEKFVTHEVIPDVISQTPRHELFVEYDTGAEATFGNELTPTVVKKQPRVSWVSNDSSEYTLIMSDPDAPSRETPSRREFLHWLVVNIPGTDVPRGTTVAAYVGSGPSEGSGAHRYVFTVWRQNRTLVPDEYGRLIPNTSREGRPYFHTMDFAKKITGQENPRAEAANFYEASFDDYVPILHKQLGK